MSKMKTSEIFSAEITPSIVLLDVKGRANPVLTPERAEHAVALADSLQQMGGTGKMSSVLSPEDAPAPGASIILYYSSDRGRPTKGEIARVARIIARSEIRDPDSELLGDGKTLYVTGSRAVVYPQVAAAGSDKVVFLVSTTVWYNENRAVCAFPCGTTQEQLFLDDINARLTEGKVSLPR